MRKIVLAALLAAGCAALTKPEGDGGWSEARRHEELVRRAAAASVALDGAPPPAEAGAPLTLAQALAAGRRNRRVAEADRDLAIAAARVRAARASLLPRTTAEGQYTWYSDSLTTALEGGTLPGLAAIPPRVEIREQEVGTVGALATLPIDLSGELRYALRAAQAGYRGEAARRWAVVLDEEAATTRAFFALLEAEQLAAVTGQRLDAQRAQLANAEQYYRTGRLTKNELLVVQVAVRDTEQELTQRRLTIDEARWVLNQTIGLSVDAPTRVVPLTAPPLLSPLDPFLADTLKSNPALTMLLEEQQRLDAQATSLARARLPRFSGGGRLDWNSQDILDPRRLEAGFVGFAWDLGTDGRREAELAAARLAADRHRLAIEGELRGLERAVRRLHRATEERLAALATADASVGQAEEHLRIREQQFTVGRATSEDVLDAEALLARQRAARASALYQAHVRRAELEQLTGRPLDRLYTDAR